MRKFIGWVQIIISSIVLLFLTILIIYNLYSINDPELIINKYPKAGGIVGLFLGYLLISSSFIVMLRNGLKRIKKQEIGEIHIHRDSG